MHALVSKIADSLQLFHGQRLLFCSLQQLLLCLGASSFAHLPTSLPNAAMTTTMPGSPAALNACAALMASPRSRLTTTTTQALLPQVGWAEVWPGYFSASFLKFWLPSHLGCSFCCSPSKLFRPCRQPYPDHLVPADLHCQRCVW